MRNRLFVLGRFAHDPQCVLAAVYRLALVALKECANFPFCLIFLRQMRLKLLIAPFAYADGRRVLLYDPQFALLHNCSLAHLAGRA